MIRPVIIVIVGLALSDGRASAERALCALTDYAPETIHIRATPSAKASSVKSVPQKEVSAFVRLDAFSATTGNWLKIRDDQVEGWVSARNVVCPIPADAAQEIISGLAAEVLRALKEENLGAVSDHVHPVRGLRFSPYAAVDHKADVVMNRSQVKNAPQETTRRTWGSDDGSGAPIRLTFPRYYHKFVYDRDFSKASKILYNGQNDGTRKAMEEYPNAIVVDYELPETGKTAEEHLRLIFEEQEGTWYLVGLVHDGLTI